jgi:hypothetical protein
VNPAWQMLIGRSEHYDVYWLIHRKTGFRLWFMGYLSAETS